ncbi:MAG: hypothetical protein J5483_03545 [Lachnospiraceae bacterium]|nr:hypothetical protein [Lachnospiraceae bacterium]
MRETRKHAIDRSALKQDRMPDEPQLPEEKEPESIPEQTEHSAAEAATKEPQIQANKEIRKKGRGKVALILIAVVILLAITCFKIYVDNDYEPLHTHDEYQQLTSVEIQFSDNVIALEDMERDGDAKKTGFIFYGDDKIQRECYLPLMIALSNQGYSVYLPTTFGNIPILNLEGAEYVSRTYPHVKNWYIVAHGKACPVAAKYAASHSSKLKGLIFLGGYSRTDLSDKNLKLLSITGSRDTILDQGVYVTMKTNDPQNTVYLEIEGGNHTGFTDTFLIRKDSEAAISSDEQIQLTATAIESFVTAH